MEIAFFLVLAIVLVMIGLVNKGIKDSVHKMSNPKSLFVVQDTIKDKGFRAVVGATSAGAEKHGYVWDCMFDFDFYGLMSDEPIKAAVWRNTSTNTLLTLYYAQGKSFYDFVTFYEDKIELTTSSGKDALMLPTPPNHYAQAFSGLDLTTLLTKHEQARVQLERKLSLPVRALTEDALELMTKSIHHQMEYIQTLPGWNWSGAYWYFIRRNLLINRPIKV